MPFDGGCRGAATNGISAGRMRSHPEAPPRRVKAAERLVQRREHGTESRRKGGGKCTECAVSARAAVGAVAQAPCATAGSAGGDRAEMKKGVAPVLCAFSFQ